MHPEDASIEEMQRQHLCVPSTDEHMPKPLQTDAQQCRQFADASRAIAAFQVLRAIDKSLCFYSSQFHCSRYTCTCY